jgi:tRNA dimethylallyltransferase
MNSTQPPTLHVAQEPQAFLGGAEKCGEVDGAHGSVICVVGPTASGKSALAERVALELGSSVVSVDAMQVYRGMDIGTAKTPVHERACDLLMVDCANPQEVYSCARFQEEARSVLNALIAAGKTPVLCGGTGLYLDAVIDDMHFSPGVTGDERRERYEAFAAAQGAQALWDELERRDPQSAALIHPHNVRRVVRALEMADDGDSYARRKEQLPHREPYYQASLFALNWPRELLYQRINERVDAMFEAGLVEEVAGLAAAGPLSDTAAQAIGYKELLVAFAGETTLEEARELIKQRTRVYAKRQLSWLRRDGRCVWLDPTAHTLEELAATIIATHRATSRCFQAEPADKPATTPAGSASPVGPAAHGAPQAAPSHRN